MARRCYYGDDLSENMTITPEGYLICQNAKIGRTGTMRYLGEELGIEECRGQEIEVIRTPEELFSAETIASFEGKPITNNHPSENLDVSTVSLQSRGHAQNVRKDGDFLVADLFVTDAGLISEIQERLKRQLSCGYDCAWIPISEKKFEQREILGNHVAVVPSGRAGPRVAIQDTNIDVKGGITQMSKVNISQKFLAAVGLKHWAKDAEPEEIAKAMDDMRAEEIPVEAKKAVDADPALEGASEMSKIIDMMNKLLDRIEALESREEAQGKEPKAEEVLDAVEEELEANPQKAEEDKVEDADPLPKAEEDVCDCGSGKFIKDCGCSATKPIGVKDAGLRKLVQDMKPIILAIPDEGVRLDVAKKFSKAVKDSRSTSDGIGYGGILAAANEHRRAAMDKVKPVNQTERTQTAAEKWKARGEAMKGGQ